MLLFFAFIICPPIWIIFTLPLGHKFNKVPIIKFMSYLTSHIYLMIHLMIVGIMPLYPVVRPSLLPYWYEWGLLVWLSGLLLFELTNPSDKSGLGSIKILVLLFGVVGVGCHVAGMTSINRQTLLADADVCSEPILRVIISLGLCSNIRFFIIPSSVRPLGHHHWRSAERLGKVLGGSRDICVRIFHAYCGSESIISKLDT